MEHARKWFPQPDIDWPCVDISYQWVTGIGATLTVVMHFSGVVDGYDKDLEITFSKTLAVQWEDEFFGLIDSPEEVPKCSGKKFSNWVHPTLIVQNSRWAERYAARKYSESDPQADAVTHYYLVAMNDLLHVLAECEPETRWIEPTRFR